MWLSTETSLQNPWLIAFLVLAGLFLFWVNIIVVAKAVRKFRKEELRGKVWWAKRKEEV